MNAAQSRLLQAKPTANADLPRTLSSIAILAACGVLICSDALAGTRAVAPRLPRTTVWTDIRPQVGKFNVDNSQIGNAKPVQTITQYDAAGILRVGSADIGADATVNISQPSSTATLLVKTDGGYFQNQTVIEGMLNANGQVYIYNPNGIIFGATSKVNVNSLVASTLRINDDRFLSGLLAPNVAAFFVADPDATRPDGTLVGTPGAVTVEGDSSQQAALTAATGGKILLVAPTVVNNGKLSAPNGQVALAAGQTVYLASPSDIRMRGLLIEVNNDAVASSNGNPEIPAATSTATNDVFGKISVGTGNATLVGLAVNQNGVISATTSVSVNGSIYLHARDGAGQGSTTAPSAPMRGGELVLGADSVTAILPTLDDATTTSGSNFNASLVDLAGSSVHLARNAQIVAPGGDVSIIASATASTKGNVTPSPGSDITLDAGALIDVSGTTSTRLAMESNVLEVELRGTEFADDPLLRNSVLRGKTVSVDVRQGNLLFADIQDWLDLVQSNVGQLTAIGGTVYLQADGAVKLNAGSRVDVSGGYVTYNAGHVATTQLTYVRNRYDINSAPSGIVYDGLIDAAPSKRNYEQGYVQGYDAGTITVVAPDIALDGTLTAKTTIGARQRNVADSSRPHGGQLIVGNQAKLADSPDFFYDKKITLGSNSGDSGDSGGSGGGSTDGLTIDAQALSAQGFSRLGMYTDGAIVVNKDVELAAGGSMTLVSGDAIDLASNITAAGGTISAEAKNKLSVARGVELDVAGRWTNDRTATSAQRDSSGRLVDTVVTQGGSISLSAPQMTIEDGARLDASGGAWLDASGKLNSGKGGKISVSATTDAALAQLTLGDDVRFAAYGLASGGSLTLSGADITLGKSAEPDDLELDADFFQQGGFAAYDVRAAGNLTVASGTTIAPLAQNWVSDRQTEAQASGTMRSAFEIATLPVAAASATRQASSLSLSALPSEIEGKGQLKVEAGARIVTDPGATVSLSAGRQLTVDGTISTPGGAIKLALQSNVAAVDYSAARSIWIGAQAVLDASGTSARLWRDGNGYTRGDLFDGGSIEIGSFSAGTQATAPGYVVVEDGARLDVSGTTATMTLQRGARGGYETKTVASAGGSIDIRAREGLLVEGELSAAGGNASAAGGTLSLVIDRDALDRTGYPSAERNLIVAASDSLFPTLGTAGSALVGWEGRGYISAATINAGGFDWVNLKSQNLVSFDLSLGDLGLRARSGITVDTPLLAVAAGAQAGSTARLSAPYVAIGNADWRYQSAVPAATSSADEGQSGRHTLSVDAGTVDIVGHSALKGFDAATISASGDIRLLGEVPVELKTPTATALPALAATGSFSVDGTMTLVSAQLYPTTMSQFTLATTGTDNRISFGRNGKAATMPLSAAGSLTVSAQTIDQDGVLRAPLGEIILNAVDTLAYGAGSLTSVAASGLIPLGFVQNGRDWLYDFGNGNTVNLSDTTASNYFALPEKRIVSSAAAVDFKSGAKQDLSGGGDLYAYEFTAGAGGSRDVLAASSNGGTTYAIVPGYTASVAPSDFEYAEDSALKPGDRIYLSGIDGLAAGYYILLPARYALLPGAYTVSAVAGTTDLVRATANLDGSWLAPGRRVSLGGAIDGRSSGFLVTPAAQVRQQSEYADYSANAFLGELASAPSDGGHVVFDVTRSLTLDGKVLLGAASGGSKGIADISAPQIAIVNERSDALPDESAADALKLAVSDLMALGADSLLLGATRVASGSSDALTVGAEQVVVDNDSAHTLSGPEIIIAANDSVTLKSGSAIAASGTLNRTPRALSVSDRSAPTSGADGALVRLSNGAAVSASRTATAADGTASTPAGEHGTLVVEAGVKLAASGSLLLDATYSTTIDSILELGSGAALGLGARLVNLGSGAPETPGILSFDSAALAALGGLAELALTSYSTIDIYGEADLGSTAMKKLSLAAGGLRGMDDTAQASFTAGTLRFDGAGSDAGTASAASAGSVAFTAKDIEIGDGRFALHGFATATLKASNEIRAVGDSGALSADHALMLSAGRITARGGKSADINAGGKLTLAQGSGTVGTLPALEYGGKLAFSGQTITSNATITALAGQVSLSSTATAADVAAGLDLSAGSINVTGGTISAAGATETFGSTVAYAAAGDIVVNAGVGDVRLGSAATLDVSATGASAGTIALSASNGANGQAILDGTLKGGSNAGQTQGSFTIDVDRLDASGTSSTFGALNAKLNESGFSEARSFRVRHQDEVALAAGETISARQLLLSVDNGDIAIDGTIDARGAKGGSIALYAGEQSAGNGQGNVRIGSNARLLASATSAATSSAGSTGDGGSIVIGTATADGSAPGSIGGDAGIVIASGARLDVSGAGAGQGGSVLLRAPRLDSNDDVALSVSDRNTLGNAVVGARDFAIEGYRAYEASAITAADVETITKVGGTVTNIKPSGTYYDEASAFLGSANKSAMQGRLGDAVKLRAGVEVYSDGDLTVSVNEDATNPQDRGWNLNAWRFGGEAGVLTLRAAGNLTIAGSISDGFVKPASGTTVANKLAMPDWAIDTNSATNASSWSYRLVGGADRSAANVLATSAGAGDVKLTFARSTGKATDLPVALIRTGTGSIDVAAGSDVVLDTLDLTTRTLLGGDFSGVSSGDTLLGASLYTAGRATTLAANFSAPTNKANTDYGSTATTGAVFTSAGGAISIVAQNDVLGPVTEQMINNWLFRQGRSYETSSGDEVFDSAGGKVQNTAWWTRFDYFNQGIATFGGGDITVIAQSGDVSNVSASVATNAYLPSTSAGGTTAASALYEQGGGDLLVRAGGDIRGGSYYVQKGSAVIEATGSLLAGDHLVAAGTADADGNATPVAARTILAVGDAQFAVSAGKDLAIEGIFNPTLSAQSSDNTDIGNMNDPYTPTANKLPAQYASYSTYSDESSVTLTALAGTLLLNNNATAVQAAGGSDINRIGDAFVNLYLLQPASFSAAALSGDIRIGNGFSLAPAASGQLELLAAGSIVMDFRQDVVAQAIVMMDRDPTTVPTATHPVFIEETLLQAVSGSVDGLAYHTRGGLHADDSDPVRIVARDGDIRFSEPTDSFAVALVLPKRAEISAGRDIIDLGFNIQQLASTDVSTISAGRDIINSTRVGVDNLIGETVSGPGRVDFTAGRDFDLGNSAGVVTRGNLDNAYLPSAGAGINVIAGASADFSAFASAYASSLATLSAAERAFLVADVRLWLERLQPSTSAADLDALTPQTAWEAIAALPSEARKSVLIDLFYDRLARVSGAKGNSGLDLSAFDQTIASLFPSAAISGGDINVFGSQLKTERGGAINVFAPGGSVYAGLTDVPAYLQSKSASELGVFTIGGGAIQALVKNDFLVNQGRVFTLGGGDITLVSQYGDIDAGKGAKTAQAAPPPLLTTDAQGNTVVDISGSITGSGIATLQTDATVAAASVYPIAPRGVFDAGDAGVRSSGTVSIVASVVLNASNIAAAGSVSGAGTVDTGGLGGAVGAPTNTVPSKSDDFAKAVDTQSASSGALTVEVLGYGGEAPATPPAAAGKATNEAMPVAPAAAPEEDEERKKSRKQS